MIKDPTIDLTGADSPADEAAPYRAPRRINVGAHTVVQGTNHLPEEQQALLLWLHRHACLNNWTWADFRREADIDSTTISRIWHDRYRYSKGQLNEGERVPVDRICAKIAALKQKLEKHRVKHSEGFLELSVWENVQWLCERAFTRRKMGFIYGESQAGKSRSLEEVELTFESTYLIEVAPGGGAHKLLKDIAEKLNVPNDLPYEKLLPLVCKALNPRIRLIIDEVHRFFTTQQKTSVMRCFDLLRYIFDRSKCGMVICSTPQTHDEMESGPWRVFLKQMRRRGLYELRLPSIPVRKDLDLICKSRGLPPATGEAETLLLHTAKHFGLGMIFTRVDDAVDFATKAKEPIKWTHFLKAASIVKDMGVDANPDIDEEKLKKLEREIYNPRHRRLLN